MLSSVARTARVLGLDPSIVFYMSSMKKRLVLLSLFVVWWRRWKTPPGLVVFRKALSHMSAFKALSLQKLSLGMRCLLTGVSKKLRFQLNRLWFLLVCG